MPAENSSSSSQLQVWNEFGQTFISILAKQSKTCSTPKFFFTVSSNETLNQVSFFIHCTVSEDGRKETKCGE